MTAKVICCLIRKPFQALSPIDCSRLCSGIIASTNNMAASSDKPQSSRRHGEYMMGLIAAAAGDMLESAAADVGSVSSENLERVKLIYAMSTGVYPYCEEHSSQPSEALVNIFERTNKEDWPKFSADHALHFPLFAGQMTGYTEGNFLAFLVRVTKARHCLEIGTFTGFGSLSMAEVLPEDGTVTALELQEPIANYARENFDKSPHGKKINIMIGPAMDSLEKLVQEGKKFDLVFVDADKGGYKGYIETTLDQLLAPGGAIVVDNTLFGGGMLYDIANKGRKKNALKMDEFNKWVAQDPRMHKVMLPVRDGVTLITRAQ